MTAEHPDYTSLSGENGTIRLAVTVENKPAVYLKDNLCTGFEMEFLTLFARQYGYKFEIEAVSFGSVIAGIAAGKYDMASASLNITPEREESVDFSDPYTAFDVVMVVKNTDVQKNSRTLADFENANLGVVTGSIYDAHSKAIFPDAKIAYYQTFADLFLCVQQGKIDGFMADEPNFNSVKRVSTDLSSWKVPDLNVEIGYGFQKNEGGDTLKAEMDAFIEELKADGTIDKLIDKWYGDTEPAPTLTKPDFSDNKTMISVAVDTGRKPFVYIRKSSFYFENTER